MKENKRYKLHQVEEHENDESWAISYGDMITLLLSFFVIFFSTDFKKNQENKLDEHLTSSLKVFDSLATNKGSFSSSKGDKDLPDFKLLENVKVTKLDDRLLVTFDQMNFFDSGVVDPNKEGVSVLKAFVAKYLPYAGMYKIGVKAFTDHKKVMEGHRYKDNMELSTLRALGALRILQKEGIPLDRIEISGYGEMNILKALIDDKKLDKLTQKEIDNISRTLVLVIKHDNEKSIL